MFSVVYSVAQCVICVAVCDIWYDVLFGVYAFRMPGVQCSVWCTLLHSVWFVLQCVIFGVMYCVVCMLWCVCGVYAVRMPGVQCSVWCTLLHIV